MIITTVRIQRHVADALNAYTARLQRAVDARPEQFPSWMSEGRVSAGTAVQYLLYSQSRHSERRKKSAGRGREAEARLSLIARRNGACVKDGNVGPSSTRGGPDDASAPPTEDER